MEDLEKKKLKRGRPTIAKRNDDVVTIAFKVCHKDKVKLNIIVERLGLQSVSQLVRLYALQLIDEWEKHLASLD